MSSPFVIEHVRHPSRTEPLLQRLQEWNFSIVGRFEFEPLRLAINDQAGEVAAGLLADTGLGWLFINVLWVPEHLRGQGMGRALVDAAHTQARQRGCHSALVDTMDWQARPFYEKLGYHCFGTLDDFPIGHQRFFMQRRLGED
jgi:GNAT superfamily N-acetyltransferase